MSFRVAAIPTKVADTVRSTKRSPGYGHPAHVELATGYGPCRHCLRTFDIGKDHRILFTYDPFYGIEELPLPGPVFVHAEPCVRFDETAGFPETLRNHRLTLAAYGEKRKLVSEHYIEDDNVERTIEQFLPATAFVTFTFATPKLDATTSASSGHDSRNSRVVAVNAKPLAILFHEYAG